MMFHWLFEEGDWFAPKRYGYGAGVPIAWQGWVVLALYVLIALSPGLVAVLIGPVATAIAMAVLLLATWWLIVVTRNHTRGGWRWRWGEED